MNSFVFVEVLDEEGEYQLFKKARHHDKYYPTNVYIWTYAESESDDWLAENITENETTVRPPDYDTLFLNIGIGRALREIEDENRDGIYGETIRIKDRQKLVRATMKALANFIDEFTDDTRISLCFKYKIRNKERTLAFTVNEYYVLDRDGSFKLGSS